MFKDDCKVNDNTIVPEVKLMTTNRPAISSVHIQSGMINSTKSDA